MTGITICVVRSAIQHVSTYPIDQLAMLHIQVTEISIDSVLRMLLSSVICICIYIIAYILSSIKRRVRQFFSVLLSYLFYYWTLCFLLINYLFLSARQFLSLSAYLNGNLNGRNTFAINSTRIDFFLSAEYELSAKWSILQENLYIISNCNHSKILLYVEKYRMRKNIQLGEKQINYYSEFKYLEFIL